jgi:spore germination cell wall hydrolase CwlJ-like protein
VAYDHEIAVMTVFMEASGEGPEGMLAVAHVLINRRKAGHGTTLAAVCLRPFQFSCWNTDDPNRGRMAALEDLDPVLGEAENAVMQALGETVDVPPDPTLGAINYYSTSMHNPPNWASRMTFTVEIGKHRFYK